MLQFFGNLVGTARSFGSEAHEYGAESECPEQHDPISREASELVKWGFETDRDGEERLGSEIRDSTQILPSEQSERSHACHDHEQPDIPGKMWPAAAFEHLETYLRSVFSLVGIDHEFVIAEGLKISEQRESSLRKALGETLRPAV